MHVHCLSVYDSFYYDKPPSLILVTEYFPQLLQQAIGKQFVQHEIRQQAPLVFIHISTTMKIRNNKKIAQNLTE